MKSLIIKAAKEAGKVILRNYEDVGKIRFKSPRSIVTKADILSQETIVNIIKKIYPDHNFLTEESDYVDNDSKYTWIIDPIDGTTNFVSKIGHFAVSIAFAEDNVVKLGVVYDPITKDMYFAEKGDGSYLNGQALHVSRKNKLSDCVVGFSLPSNVGISRKTFSILSKSYGSFRALRNNGSAALNLCHVAEGKFDMYFSLSIYSWDAAAAALIVQEAGGKATNHNSKDWNVIDKSIVASNKVLHSKFIRLLR